MTNRNVKDNGFALLLVLWIVTILAAVIITFVSNVAAQARSSWVERDVLLAEQLAVSAQEMLPFLATRGLGTASEDLSGLPVDVVVPAFQYRIHFPSGIADVYLESDNGKINPGTVSREFLETFFSRWAQDGARGATIADSIIDWRDADSDPEPSGAEAAAYSALGYGPRNAVVGMGDIALIQGFRSGDFLPNLRRAGNAPGSIVELVRFLTAGPAGTAINPNFASEMVLRSVPGITDAEADVILQVRQQTFFHSREEFEERTGISGDSTKSSYLVFGRGGTPAVLTIARMNGSPIRRSLRRVYFTFSKLSPATGNMENETALAVVERNVFPDFVR